MDSLPVTRKIPALNRLGYIKDDMGMLVRRERGRRPTSKTYRRAAFAAIRAEGLLRPVPVSDDLPF